MCEGGGRGSLGVLSREVMVELIAAISERADLERGIEPAIEAPPQTEREKSITRGSTAIVGAVIRMYRDRWYNQYSLTTDT